MVLAHPTNIVMQLRHATAAVVMMAVAIGCARLPLELDRAASLNNPPTLPANWEMRGGAIVGQVLSVGDTLELQPDLVQPARYPQIWITKVHRFPASLWRRAESHRFIGDSAGRFGIAPLSPGTYVMNIRAFGHEFKSRSFTIEERELIRTIWRARLLKLNGKWVLTGESRR